MNWKGHPQRIILSVTLLLAGGYQLLLSNHPFQRDPEGCASFYGLVSRNYFRYGLADTWGVPVMSMGRGAQIIFYANHPPTTPLLIAAVHLVTGYRGGYDTLPGDWQVRLPTVIFTIACIGLIYLLVGNRAGARAGLIAAALFAATPMALIYGGFPDVINPQMLFFAMLTVAAYERLIEKPRWARLGLLCAAFLGAGVMDWPAYFLVPVLGLHWVLTHKPRQWGWMILFGMFTVLLFGGFYVYLALAKGDWGWMSSLVARRSTSGVGDQGSYSTADWLYRAIVHMGFGRHTVVVCGFGLLWLILSGVRRFKAPGDRFVGLLLAWAGLHVLIGRQGVYQHEWWWWPLTPGLAIAAALAIEQVLELTQRRLMLSRRAIGIAMTLALATFTGWNMRAALIERTRVPPMARTQPQFDYTTEQFGAVIRQYTPPDAAALVTESDLSLPFWYYTDRAVKRDVWDLSSFRKRRGDDLADLSFPDAYEKWTGPAATMIIPRLYLPAVKPDLIEYLNQRYIRHETALFIIYDLTQPMTGFASGRRS